MTEPNIRDMFRAMENQLKGDLDRSRAMWSHGGIKGGSLESTVRAFLNTHLPQLFSVGTGEVIDTKGTRSGQMDLIISNQEQPLRFPINDAGLYFIEGVSGAGEIKASLNSAHLDMAIKSGASFKRLRNSFYKGDMIHTNESDKRRFYSCPPFFVLAFEAKLSVETIVSKLKDAPLVRAQDGSGDPLPPVDAVFVLGEGSAIDYGDGEGSLIMRIVDDDGNRRNVTGWAWTDSDQVLSSMLLWLNSTMPRIHRAGPISPPYFLAGGSTLPTYPFD